MQRADDTLAAHPRPRLFHDRARGVNIAHPTGDAVLAWLGLSRPWRRGPRDLFGFVHLLHELVQQTRACAQVVAVLLDEPVDQCSGRHRDGAFW